MSVINLQEYRPHKSGEAKCLSCGHEWLAVTPINMDTSIECPSCTLVRGEFLYNASPSYGSEVFMCNCGSDLFFVVRSGIFCRGCGITTSFEEITND